MRAHTSFFSPAKKLQPPLGFPHPTYPPTGESRLHGKSIASALGNRPDKAPWHGTPIALVVSHLVHAYLARVSQSAIGAPVNCLASWASIAAGRHNENRDFRFAPNWPQGGLVHCDDVRVADCAMIRNGEWGC